MKQKEKVSIVRILSDLIKADTVIDTREIDLFETICEKYNIDKKTALVEAQKISLAEALEILSDLTDDERKALVAELEQLAVADGRCEPEEALLLVAIKEVLVGEAGGVIDCGIDVPDNIEPFTMFYVESEYDNDTNEMIKSNYRTIETEFRLAGFEFVYIPRKSWEYSQINPERLMSIICHIAPNVAMTDVDSIYQKICTSTTVDFCRSLLYNKLGLKSIYDTEPSLLVKIGDSRVSLKSVHNYFKFVIGDDVLENVRYLVDTYKQLAKDEKILVRYVEPQIGHFEYRGFNKSVFDLLAFPGKSFESRILVDIPRHRIYFEDINVELELSAYERALYAFLLYADVMGKVIRRNETSAVKRDRFNVVFNKIYNMIGKWENDEKKSYLSLGLPSSLSRIKKQINGMELLANKNNYIPETIDDVISLKVDTDKIFILDSISGKKVLMKDAWVSL